MQDQKSQRLESLDILRGFDLFLLVALQPVLVAIGQVWDNSYYHTFLFQFDHEVWEGFRLWDLIMPLFLFMTGVTVPFSLDSKIGQSVGPIYRHIFRRFAILWFLGMVIQGNLLSFDWHYFKLYSNTLQAIAVGYLFTSLAYFNLPIRKVITLSICLLVVYTIPFVLDGNYSPQENFAIRVDKKILGSWMDGVYWDQGIWDFSDTYDYSWIWSSLTFTVTVMMGCFAGKIIKENARINPNRVFRDLIAIGFICLLAGVLLHFQIPIIKRIWTSSMTLFSGGICFILMAIFYYVIDVKKVVKPFRWLKIYGMNSIVAYFIGEFVNFRSVVHSLTFGLENQWPELAPIILTVGNFYIVFLILYLLYKNKYFVKI